ncbi:hypothetical protein HMPREF9413_3241 [Paenibacillus sp. HGF7]|nr:hypothetical protein HMPREF9413_3241 [Paenibacillus sp. HGF7]
MKYSKVNNIWQWEHGAERVKKCLLTLRRESAEPNNEPDD